MTTFFVVCLSAMLVSQPAYANENVYDCYENNKDCLEEGELENPSSPTDEEQNNLGPNTDGNRKIGLSAWEYIKTFLALLFVVGILFFLLKFLNRKNKIYDKNRYMKNLGGISLGQQKSIQLVMIGEQYYLVGVGEDIRLLKEITNETEIEQLVSFYNEADEVSVNSPVEKVLSFLSTTSKKEQQKESQQSEQPFTLELKKQMDKMTSERKEKLRKLSKKEQGDDD